jgi:septal ring factor EnvC (AmiA/AmiB activator)
VKKRLQNLMMLNTEIAGKRRTIDTIRHDISNLEDEIEMLSLQLEKLQKELEDCKEKYVKSMRYMHRNRSAQSQMMFIFSADNLTQMYRRLRFMREYAAYQHVQGDEVKAQQEAVNVKFQEIALAREKKTQLLAKGERERVALEGKQTEQQNVVKTLQKEQKTIQNIIAQQKKKDAALNAQIDRLIAEEVARQKARAEAEARRRAEAAARERELAEARAREEKARAEAKTAKDKKSREEAERRVREAEEKRVAAQRKAESMPMIAPSEDTRISGNFESNRGRLPMPITGAYRIVSHFGQYNVEGLRNVTLDNKGINIKGENGAQARSIFDGEVSGVFSFGGTMVVMVRHGSYISVYCNLVSVNVHRGQRVSTRQALGRVGADNILQFQLRKETTKLNPESWLGR